MEVKSCLSWPVSIFMAGDRSQAEKICQSYCDEVGMCVTVTETVYIYTGGSETGFVVGLINYPRFPAEFQAITETAFDIACRLREALGQSSFSIQSPATTSFYSWRVE